MIDLKAIKNRHAAGMDSGGSAHQDREVLLAEVERLQHDIADLQMLRDEHQMDNMHAFQEGGEDERRKVVAWLLNWQGTMDDRITHDDVDHAISCIERGEHLKESP